MKLGGGVLYGTPRANALPLFFSHGRARLQCLSSFTPLDHVTFIKDVAATQPPQYLSQLLSILKTRGDSIVSPGARQGFIPLALPIAKNSSGSTIALLRWPTAPPGMELPVVEVRKHGVWLLAKNVDQFIHRILVEEDAKNSQERNEELFSASTDAEEKFYIKGDFAESKISSLDIYLLKKVGLFPDIIERKFMQHFEEGDHVSALVTGEFYTKEHFPGFGQTFCFQCRGFVEDVAKGAPWDDEQIEYSEEKMTEEGRQQDIKKGKAPAQVLLDEAAFLLDLASIDGTWDDYLERIAECYEETGLHEIARFICLRATVP